MFNTENNILRLFVIFNIDYYFCGSSRVHAILPPTCPCEDRIVQKLDAYAKKIENEIWETADSKVSLLLLAGIEFLRFL